MSTLSLKKKYPGFLNTLCWVLCFNTLLVLAVGASVTSTGSGLSVPDWPLAYGQWFPNMVGGVLYEHGHRILAGITSIITVAVVVLFHIYEPRNWVKKLTWLALFIVLTQATLGGLTVLLRLPHEVSIAHACLAQIYFSLSVVLLLVTSKAWRIAPPQRLELPEAKLPWFALLTTCFFFVQLLMGATMRHWGAGLAIPDFPTAFGGWIPAKFDFSIAIHFAHRMGAFFLVAWVSVFSFYVYRNFSRRLNWTTWVGALLGLLSFQFLLGASVIWSKRSVLITVAHLVVGALCLATSVGFTSVLFRAKKLSTFRNSFDAKAYWELTKPGICIMALIMAAVGFFIGSFSMNWGLFLTSLFGIGLVGASCGTLNQYLEHELDSKMPRTANRPIPTGKITTGNALVLGVVFGVLGEAILFLGVNTLTGALGLLTIVGYLGIYTPSKRWNSLSTLLGAIPGAMPPLLGYTAACAEIDMIGILLFAILFLWQIPHFLAIGWMYRDDYSKASFPILTVVDASGRVTVQQAILYTLILLPITLLPSAWGVVGHLYSVGASVLGIYFLYQAILLGIRKNRLQARRLFFTSLIYLPVLGLLFASDKWIFG